MGGFWLGGEGVTIGDLEEMGSFSRDTVGGNGRFREGEI